MSVTYWTQFYKQCKADLKLWCYFVIFQQICRLCFICALSTYLAEDTTLTTIFLAMLHGVRFDSLWATVWTFIALVLFTLPNTFGNFNYAAQTKFNRGRQYLGGVFTIVTTLLYLVSIEYFKEYQDLFNHFLFGIFYDDKYAIFKTIIAEHHVLLNIAILCIIFVIYVKFSYVFTSNPHNTYKILNFRENNNYSTIKKVLITSLIILFYTVSFRGSIGKRPIQLKDAGVTTDAFLNKAIISPFSALRYAIKEHLSINSQENALYATISKDNINKQAKCFFNDPAEHVKLSEYMQKTATGSTLPKPKHIFLLIGESLDAWPLQQAYRKFNLTPNLQNIISKGLHLKYFLPCANGTMSTLNTIITGLPDAELRTNYQKSSYRAYPTAIATQFKNLNFKTQFFYGGYLSWQRLEDFAYAQDFDAVYGAAHISDWKQTNEWGVDDRTLFTFIEKTIATATTPTFNVIMTTSNHPPFSIDLKQEGFDEEKTKNLLAQYPHTRATVKELGHIWYADKTIGEFIEKITKQDDSTLFAITGDHFGRRHILPNPPLFDTSAVPLILYGNNIHKHYKFAQHTAGSHLNLSATLIELVAPRDFTYYAMGKSLFAPVTDSVGIGAQRIVTSEFIASTTDTNLMYLDEKVAHIPIEQLHSLKDKHNQAMSIAWWIIKKGDVTK